MEQQNIQQTTETAELNTQNNQYQATQAQSKKNLIESMTEKLKKKYKIIYYLEAFYLYKDGYYQRQEEKKFLSLLKSELPKGHKDYSTAKSIYDSLSIEEGIILDKDDTRIEPKELINFKNHLYNPITGDTLPHTSDLIFFTQTPHNYNPKAEINDITKHLFNNFIKGYSKDDQEKIIELIFQLIGVALSNDRTFKNFFFIQGLPNTGKSTLLGLIMKILGTGMYSAIPINDLNEQKTSLFRIMDKKANILTETTSKKLNDEVITTMKKLTGGSSEVISCKIKYQNDIEVKSRALLIFAGNNVPELWSEGDLTAFIDRMILIDFRGQLKDEDKIDNILEMVNYEYIIAESMRAFERFIKNNKVFTIPSVVIENRKKMKNDNPISAFVSECSVVPDYKIHSNSLFEMFQQYCCDNGYPYPEDKYKITFNKKIEEIGYEKKKVRETEGKNVSYIGFIGLKPPQEYLEPYFRKLKRVGLTN